MGTAAGEASFHDTLSQNLSRGEILLLVVGDGIREELESMADLLASSANLSFHLELIELRLFDRPDADGYLVVPHRVGRTREVERAVIRVETTAGSEAKVDVEILDQVSNQKGRPKLRSLDDFENLIEAERGDQLAAQLRAVAESWETKETPLRFNKASVNLRVARPRDGGPAETAMTISADAHLWCNFAKLAARIGLDVEERLRAIGFEQLGSEGTVERTYVDMTQQQTAELTDFLDWLRLAL